MGSVNLLPALVQIGPVGRGQKSLHGGRGGLAVFDRLVAEVQTDRDARPDPGDDPRTVQRLAGALDTRHADGHDRPGRTGGDCALPPSRAGQGGA